MKGPFSINDMFLMLDILFGLCKKSKKDILQEAIDNTNTTEELVYRIQDIALNLSDIAYKKGCRINIDKFNLVDPKVALAFRAFLNDNNKLFIYGETVGFEPTIEEFEKIKKKGYNYDDSFMK